jgi:hypothetical protein
MDLDPQPKVVAIDEQANDNIVPLNRFGEADRPAPQPFDPRSQRQVFTFDVLGVTLTWLVLTLIHMSPVGTPVIGIKTCDAKGLKQRFQLQKYLILTTPKDIGQNFATAVVDRMPKPSWLFLAPNIRPHFIHFCFIRTPDHHLHIS